MMTDESLAEIKAREQAATDGPWEHLKIPLTRNALHRERFPNAGPVKIFYHWLVTNWIHPQLKDKLPIIAISSGPYHEEKNSIRMADEDGEFLAHSRQDIPDLLAEVERLRTENALEKGHYIAARQRLSALHTDAMIAHRWFEKHFGEIMNGRDFAVKCEMADRLQAESSGGAE